MLVTDRIIRQLQVIESLLNSQSRCNVKCEQIVFIQGNKKVRYKIQRNYLQ